MSRSSRWRWSCRPSCGLLARPFEVVALVKPQFEVGKGQVGKRGVVRDPALHQAVLDRWPGRERLGVRGGRDDGFAAPGADGQSGVPDPSHHGGRGGDVANLIVRALAAARDGSERHSVRRIGIAVKPKKTEVEPILRELIDWLREHGREVLLDPEAAAACPGCGPSLTRAEVVAGATWWWSWAGTGRSSPSRG